MEKDEITLALGKVAGELKGVKDQLEGINKRLDKQNGHMDKHDEIINQLPCLAHSESIQAIENIIIENKTQKESNRLLSFNRRTQIVVAIIAGLAYLIGKITGG